MATSTDDLPLSVILAAGLGTRMRSSLAKVLHPLCGRPMVRWVVESARAAGTCPILVLHHQREAVMEALPDIPWALQEHPRGTGDAVAAAREAISRSSVVMVLPGDAPLLEADLLRSVLARHRGALCTVVSTVVEEPGAYGRLVRQGGVTRVVESREATDDQLAIGEVNTGVYAFDARWLLHEVLPSLREHPPKGELHITDAVELASRAGGLKIVTHPDPEPFTGINDRWALALAEDILQERILRRLGEAGVTIERPMTIRVEASVQVGEDVVIEPGVVLAGDTHVGRGSVVGAHSVLKDSRVGPGVFIKPGTVMEGAAVGAGSAIGPMAHLRSGTCLEEACKVGNFVEVKKSHLGRGVKASHLTYLGDATIGCHTNIGAGTITCNYDGQGKHRTEIGEAVFVGSNCSLVAPVQIGDRALVGAGSVITAPVPPDALAVARSRQVNREGGGAALMERFRRRAARAAREGNSGDEEREAPSTTRERSGEDEG